jgi:hypothetical protein
MLRFAFVLTLSCVSLFAQATSQIQGVVRDATGSAVPGAEVKSTQTDTCTVRTATTASDGGYVLSNLAIGPYRLEVGKAGFATYVQTGIVLQVNTNPTIDVSLSLGAVSCLKRSRWKPMRRRSKPRIPASAPSLRTSAFSICR